MNKMELDLNCKEAFRLFTLPRGLMSFCMSVDTLHHVPVGVVRDGVDVRRHLVALLALVHLDDLLRVDGQHLVGVHHHAEETRVRLRGGGRRRERRSFQMRGLKFCFSFGRVIRVNMAAIFLCHRLHCTEIHDAFYLPRKSRLS